MTAATAIEVVGLHKRYGTRRAVDGVSFSVGVGEVFGLLGPNGAGKTTTVEILEGYREPDAGTVRVLGLDPSDDAPTLARHVGVMLQEGGLYPGVRPLEALELFASYYQEPDDPQRLLSLVGLDDVATTLVRRLSGGEAQRLSLALALIGRPELVFLDEPTAGMDPRARVTTWKLVHDLRDRGVTVVLTTHAMDEAEQLCDRLAILDRGRIVAEGTPAELTARAGTAEVAFRAAAGLDHRSMAKALGLAADSVTEPQRGRYVIAASATPTLLADLTRWLAKADITLEELTTGRTSLEALFLRITGEDGE